MTNMKIADRLSFVLAGVLTLASMLVPRLPGIRPRDIAGGVIPVGPLSGGLLDANTMVMTGLLLASAAAMTALRPQRAKQWGLLFAFAPTAWMAVVMVLHGPGNIWPIALVFATAYGGLVTLLGLGIGKLLARLFHQEASAGAA